MIEHLSQRLKPIDDFDGSTATATAADGSEGADRNELHQDQENEGDEYGRAWQMGDNTPNTTETALVDPNHLDPLTGEYVGAAISDRYTEMFKHTYKELLKRYHPDKSIVGTVDPETREIITEEVVERRREMLA